MTEPEISRIDGLKTYVVKLVDAAYSASLYTIVGYTAAMILLAIVALAVYLKVVDLPQFHP